ncbi:Zn-dependent hydrolase [Salinigranum sp. GCM10025319]|uniref:Zn-dependent hydrolase n=1 Tax=Salinigranum sp. GCM10025319 TaxID=3252687 RepID=UPI003608E46D
MTGTHVYPVDSEQLRRDIEVNGQFGMVDTDEGISRTVLPGTEPNRLAREYLVDRMINVGLSVDVDAVGNIVGRWAPESCDPDAAPVAAGSHLDSVPFGGIFDGPLGVYAALNAVSALQDADVGVERPIEVVSFTGEEGTRFADGLLGSSVATGSLGVDEALALSDEGETLREVLSEIGFHGEGRLDASGWHAWLELHVEQGETLDRLGVPAGVVTTIAGTTRQRVTIEGAADHTGTTSMGDRTDALAAASELVLALERAANASVAEGTDTTVATVGELNVEPGAINVVPGRVDLSTDLRDVTTPSLDRLADCVRTTLAELEADRGVETSVECTYDVPPTDMAPVCRDALHSAGRAIGVETVDIHSGAGHDTMRVADVTDSGLLFAPSRGGYSHCGSEWTSWHACAATTELLTSALADLAGASDRPARS